MRKAFQNGGWRRELAPHWRELLFWLLLVPGMGALGSAKPRRQIAGLIETCVFLVVAISSAGKLNTLGLEFAAWNRLGRRAAVLSIVAGLLAGGVIVAVAALSDQPLGIEVTWNKVVLAISLGPVLEEVIFRGYLMTAVVLIARCVSLEQSASISIIGTAVLFSIAHLATPGITALQLCCIGVTGSLYGYVRIQFRSTVAAALAHGMYNLALYISYWLAVPR